nr:hypothetical protein [uncultured Pedobacter sp.]
MDLPDRFNRFLARCRDMVAGIIGYYGIPHAAVAERLSLKEHIKMLGFSSF